MNRSAVFMLVGNLVLFVAILAPLFTLLAWLTSSSVGMFLLIAAVLSVPSFYSFWYTLNSSNNMTVRWVWMQALGLGTVLMSLVIVGYLLTVFVNPFYVGVLVLITWVALSALAVSRAINIAPRHLKLRAPQLSNPLRVVQISDVHVGSRSPAFLQRVVSDVNSHNPDIVVITGDLLDASAVSTDDLAALANLNAPTYMCIGNHERYVDLDKALTSIRAHEVIVLRDETITTHGLHIIGIDDCDRPDSLPATLDGFRLDESLYSILLYHRPDGWQAALDRNIDLTLSGHTHAGQMFPFGFLVKRQYPNMAGLFTDQGKSLYVSIGTGTWGPIFRLGTQNEMTVIDLEA